MKDLFAGRLEQMVDRALYNAAETPQKWQALQERIADVVGKQYDEAEQDIKPAVKSAAEDTQDG